MKVRFDLLNGAVVDISDNSELFKAFIGVYQRPQKLFLKEWTEVILAADGTDQKTLLICAFCVPIYSFIVAGLIFSPLGGFFKNRQPHIRSR